MKMIKNSRKAMYFVLLYGAFLLLSCYIINVGDDNVFAAGIKRYGSL